MMRRSSCIETYAPFLAHHFAHIVIIYNSPIGQAFGIFDFEANGPDPQEEALARRLQRKKKKKRRSRGIS